MNVTNIARRSDSLYYAGDEGINRKWLCDKVAYLEAELREERKKGHMKLNVKLTDDAPMPKHAKPGDAGLDLTSRDTVEIAPGGTVMVHTGVWMEIPEGYYGEVVPRSSVASKKGVTLANVPGTIDSSYRGEIMLPLHNIAPSMRWMDHGDGTMSWEHNQDLAIIERGERVAQIIIKRYETCECVEVDNLSETERGTGGIGSTGRF